MTNAPAVTFPAVRETFGSADYVDGFTIFDVGGNRYRIAAVSTMTSNGCIFVSCEQLRP